MDGILEFSFGPPHFEECSQAVSEGALSFFFLAKFRHLPKNFFPKKKRKKCQSCSLKEFCFALIDLSTSIFG
jgi:hypothetical protein